VELLNLPAARLIVSHSLDDEGSSYAQWVKSRASRQGVSLHFIHDRLREEEAGGQASGRLSLLHDLYPLADMVTYPSLYEGFGNAFLEAVYYRKPLLVNRYPVFIVDIEPKGFDVVAIDGYVTEKTVAQVSELLKDPARRADMVERNWQLARKHFSYGVLRKELAILLTGFFGLS